MGQADTSTLYLSASPAFQDALPATHLLAVWLVQSLHSSRATLVCPAAAPATTRTASSVLLVQLDVLAVQVPTSALSACQDNLPTTDSATTTAQLVQFRATLQAVLNATLPAPPALSTPASVLPANHAAAICSTSNV